LLYRNQDTAIILGNFASDITLYRKEESSWQILLAIDEQQQSKVIVTWLSRKANVDKRRPKAECTTSKRYHGIKIATCTGL